jgi:hypothetical protein
MRLPHTQALVRIVTLGLLSANALVAQERPLPDRETFLQATRKRLQTDSSMQSGYVYLETRHEQTLGKDGRVQEESIKVYESYPGLPGEERWEQLVSENGRSRPASALEREMRDRQKKAEALARENVEQPAKQEARQQRELAERRRDFDAVLDDLFRVYDIRMQGRERLDGHDTVVFSLTPRRDAKTRTREGGQMRQFAVRAWVSESDYELVRVDAEAIDTLSMGFGLLARLHKGAKLSFVRTKVNDEVWLPSRVTYSGSARVALVAVIRRSGTAEFSGYRKFSVDTSSAYQPTVP